MSTEVSITIYDVTHQGYYSHQQKCVFGSMESILSDLKDWSTGKRIDETLLSSDSSNSEGNLPTLLASINKHSDESWLLTIWNQVPDQEGKVLSISRSREVGDPTYSANKVAEDTIAGYPSYYWFIPERSLIATIQVHALPTAPASMQAHLEHFMKNHSSHVVKSNVNEDGEVTIAGYRECDASDIFRLSPRFRIKIRRQPSDLALLRSKVDLIHRFERVEKFNIIERANPSTWQKIIPKNLRGPFSDTHIQNINTKQSFKTEVNLSQLNFLIDDWEENLSNQSKEIDYLFYVKKDPRPYRLGNSISRDKFNLDLTYDKETGIINPNVLLRELEKQRESIEKLFIDD